MWKCLLEHCASVSVHFWGEQGGMSCPSLVSSIPAAGEILAPSRPATLVQGCWSTALCYPGQVKAFLSLPSLNSEPDPHPQTVPSSRRAWRLHPLYLYPGILGSAGTLLVALGTGGGQGSVDQSRGNFQIQYLRHQIVLLIQQQF